MAVEAPLTPTKGVIMAAEAPPTPTKGAIMAVGLRLTLTKGAAPAAPAPAAAITAGTTAVCPKAEG